MQLKRIFTLLVVIAVVEVALLIIKHKVIFAENPLIEERLAAGLKEGSLFYTSDFSYRQYRTPPDISEARPRVFTYVDNQDDTALVDQWKISMSAAGFLPTVLTINHAKCHHSYFDFAKTQDEMYVKRNAKWFAFEAAGGGMLLDYKIMPVYLYTELSALHQLRTGRYKAASPTTYQIAPLQSLFIGNLTLLQPFMDAVRRGEPDSKLIEHLQIRTRADVFVYYSPDNIERTTALRNLSPHETAQLVNYHMHKEFLNSFEALQCMGDDLPANELSNYLRKCPIPANRRFVDTCAPTALNVDLGKKRCPCNDLRVENVKSMTLKNNVFGVISVKPLSKYVDPDYQLKQATLSSVPSDTGYDTRLLLCKDLIYMPIPYTFTLWLPAQKIEKQSEDLVSLDLGFSLESFHFTPRRHITTGISNMELWKFACEVSKQKGQEIMSEKVAHPSLGGST